MELILGTAQLVQPYGVLAHSAPADSASEILETASEFGFTCLDTAPKYGDAEVAIGLIEHGLKIHTKIRAGVDPSLSLTRSLDALGVPQVEVLYLHEEFRDSPQQREDLTKLSQESSEKFRSLGASIYSLQELDLAVQNPHITAIQIPLNVMDQKFSRDVVDAARKAGKSIYARSVFLQGLTVAPIEKIPESLETLVPYLLEFRNLAERFDLSPLEASIGFVKASESIDGMVIGANRVGDLREIGRAFSKDIPVGFLDACESLKTPPQEHTDPRLWV